MGTEKLVAEKLDVGSELAERWYPELASVVFTSATMAVGEDFSHFSHSVGLDRLEPGSYRTLRLDSSYDFDGSMGVALTPDLPDPNSSDYLTALEDLLFDVHLRWMGRSSRCSPTAVRWSRCMRDSLRGSPNAVST